MFRSSVSKVVMQDPQDIEPFILEHSNTSFMDEYFPRLGGNERHDQSV